MHMPLGKILSTQAIRTLTQLHAEIGGKIETNRKSGDKLRTQMMQVEAVIKLLQPEFNVRIIAPKRRRTGNPWFKRGTLYRAVVDVLRRSGDAMTADAICKVLLDGKKPPPTRLQSNNIEAAILAGLRAHEGKGVDQIGETMPAKWRLVSAPD
jgi:hypothetical protein